MPRLAYSRSLTVFVVALDLKFGASNVGKIKTVIKLWETEY